MGKKSVFFSARPLLRILYILHKRYFFSHQVIAKPINKSSKPDSNATIKLSLLINPHKIKFSFVISAI